MMSHLRSDQEGRLKPGVNEHWGTEECIFGLVEMWRLLQFSMYIWQTTPKWNELLKAVTFILLTNLQFGQDFLNKSFQLQWCQQGYIKDWELESSESLFTHMSGTWCWTLAGTRAGTGGLSMVAWLPHVMMSGFQEWVSQGTWCGLYHLLVPGYLLLLLYYSSDLYWLLWSL